MPELITFTDPYGKTRKGYEKVCPICNNSFFTRISQDYTCCKFACSNEYRRQNSTSYVELECYQCKKSFSRRKNHLGGSRSGLYFCSRKCKEFGQKKS